MLKIASKIAALTLLAALCGGCTSSISSDTLDTENANQVQQATSGVIVSTRTVKLSSDNVGALAGAAAGAAGGSALGGGARMNIIGGIGGAVIGGLLGDMAERDLTNQLGTEYVVKTTSGSLLTVVQGQQPTLQIGQHVIVIMGPKARVIADPSYTGH